MTYAGIPRGPGLTEETQMTDAYIYDAVRTAARQRPQGRRPARGDLFACPRRC